MRSTLVSDAHLRAANGKVQRELVHFLRSWPTDEWVFVGDMVDVWWHWNHTVFAAYIPFLAAIQELVAAGTPVTWVVGNHERALGQFVQQELGAVPATRWTTHTGTQRVLALHGDQAESSRLHRLAARMLGGRVARTAVRWLGPDNTWRIGRFLSDQSRSHNTMGQQATLAAQRRLADTLLGAQADVVCMGHTHAPGIEARARGQFVNLGDWVGHRTFAVVDQGVHLYRWHHQQAVPVTGGPAKRAWCAGGSPTPHQRDAG